MTTRQEVDRETLRQCADLCGRLGTLIEAGASFRLRVLVQMLQAEIENLLQRSEAVADEFE